MLVILYILDNCQKTTWFYLTLCILNYDAIIVSLYLGWFFHFNNCNIF